MDPARTAQRDYFWIRQLLAGRNEHVQPSKGEAIYELRSAIVGRSLHNLYWHQVQAEIWVLFLVEEKQPA